MRLGATRVPQLTLVHIYTNGAPGIEPGSAVAQPVYTLCVVDAFEVGTAFTCDVHLGGRNKGRNVQIRGSVNYGDIHLGIETKKKIIELVITLGKKGPKGP